MDYKITVITPTLRKNSLDLNKACLNRQTLDNFEWLIVSPNNCIDSFYPKNTRWIPEPDKRPGDFYNINKCWNTAIRESKGELIVSIVDLLWFPPDTLQRLWHHYLFNKKACIGFTGNQYEKISNDIPVDCVWIDPRVKGDSFYPIEPHDLELCIASIPRKGLIEIGGFDEEYDKAPAFSEKDMACRIVKAGYSCFIDETLQYKALYHERLTKDWDERYKESTKRFINDYSRIQKGERLKVNYL